MLTRILQHVAAQEDGRCHPGWLFLFTSVDFWVSTRPPFPLARPGTPGSRRPRRFLRTEVWVSISRESVEINRRLEPFGKGRPWENKEELRGGLGSSERRGDPGVSEGRPQHRQGLLRSRAGGRVLLEPSTPRQAASTHMTPELTAICLSGLHVECAYNQATSIGHGPSLHPPSKTAWSSAPQGASEPPRLLEA